MDDYSLSLLLVVVFYAFITVILLVIFCQLKKYRCSPKTERKYNVFVPENSLRFKDLCSKIFFTTLGEIKQECGEEAHHYLYITRTLAILITVLCPITLAVLLPVYKQGDVYPIDLQAISLGNILFNEKLLVAPFLILIIFIVSSYYVLKICASETLRISSFSNINPSSLRIIGLPKHESRASILKKVAECLNLKTESIYVVPNLSKSMEYEKFLSHAKQELLHYLDVEEFNGKRETINFTYFSSGKVDAIKHWEKQVTVYKNKLETEYKESKNTNSGVCIVNVIPHTRIEDAKDRLRVKFSNVYLTTVVVATDVKWENIENDERTTRVNHVLGTILFFFIFLFLFTPDTFFAIVYIYFSNVGLPKVLIDLLKNFLPSILTLIYQIAIVPAAVAYLVNREKHYSKSAEVISSMRKFLLFFLFNMLFIPAIGGNVVSMIIFALGSVSFKTWSTEMTFRIYVSIFLFLSVMLTQAFIVNMTDLIRIGKVIEMKYRSLRAISEREAYKAYVPPNFYYAYEYSILVTCFTIVLLFSIVYPIILIFGSVYLWVRVIDI